MRIGLTFDLQTDPTDERQAEFDPPSTIHAICRALESLGHHVVLMGNAADLLDSPTTSSLSGGGGGDLVFNLAEGAHGRCREAWVPTLLDLARIPYAGSDALTLSIGLDKVLCKRLARAEGIRTPDWISLEHPDALPATIPLTFPVIVKPRYEGSGRGIDAGAVVHDRAALAARAAWLFARCPQSLLIEEFIAGGELTVCLIGNVVPSERSESRDDPPMAYPAIQRPLDPATGLAYHVVHPAPARSVSPLMLEPALEAEARRVALRMFTILGCRDIARVDLRVDDVGRVFFLEINPLPSFDPEGSLGLLAEYLGITYAQLLGRVLDVTLLRSTTHQIPSTTQ